MSKTRKLMIGVLGAALLGLYGWSMPAFSADDGPIKIGVISEESAPAGSSISKAAKIAADEINEAGGINGRKLKLIFYDDHSSPGDAVRAFQRAVQSDHVDAVAASYISEVVLALEPWAARFKIPFIGIGASSAQISKNIHDHYEKNKYTFQGYFTAISEADAVCAFAHDILVKQLGMKTAAIVSEDAAWTATLDKEYKKCLPKAGLKVIDAVTFSPDTTDFTPIFNKLESAGPDVMITGMAHVGQQPAVQWHDRQVPIPMAGVNSQASTTTFWDDTAGAADGIITITTGASNVAITPKTIPFAKEYEKRYGNTPSYSGYAAYDVISLLADAFDRANSTDADKVVSALEKTNFVGTQGRIQFYGKDDKYTHSVKFGKNLVSGVILQWQDGKKQVPIWPESLAEGKATFPSFVKLP